MTIGTNVDALITALNDGSPKVRRSAAETLGELEETRAVEPLTLALKDTDSNVRLSVALALGMIGDASATALLTYALNDERDEAVCGALETALDMIKKNIMKKKMRLF
ncbi:MAG: HEAT repeat domain-containing protein [Euryarchaeota archaeon]